MTSAEGAGPAGAGGEDDLAAAEHVLGLLAGDEGRLFLLRLAREPALRRRVAGWAEELIALTDDIPEVAPPQTVWAALDAQLEAEEARAVADGMPLGMGARVDVDPEGDETGEDGWDDVWGAGAGAAPQDAAQGRGRRARRFLASLGLGELAVGMVAAALLAWLTYQADLFAPRAGDALEAQIGAQDAAVAFAARFDVDAGALHLQRLGQPPAEGRAYQLWMIAGEVAPVSLGLWERDTADHQIPVAPELAAMLPGAMLAISDEPSGGSPTGQPSGAILAAAPLTAP